MSNVTTRTIHKRLKTLRTHVGYAENVFLYSHESDVIMVDYQDRVTEYEVKVSRSDYNADFKKTEKHMKFKTLHDVSDIPNEFYYVCPDGMITEDQIPEYAGLIYARGTYLVQIKRASPLHNEKMPSEFWKELYLKMMAKKKL